MCCLLCRFPEAESTVSFLYRMIRAEEERHRLLEEEKKKREAEEEERAAAQAAAAMAMCSKRQPTDSAREEIRRQVTAILEESACDAEAMAMSSRCSSQVGSAQSSARGQGGQGSSRDDAVWGWSERQPTDSAREEIRRQVTAILAESAYDAEAMAMSSRGISQITHKRGPRMDYPPMPDSPSHPRDDLRELSWSSSLSEKSNSLRQRSTGLLQRSYGSQRSRVLTSASLHGFLHLPLG
jgi:membrane carboxypeptidase/penicillin-binding protein